MARPTLTIKDLRHGDRFRISVNHYSYWQWNAVKKRMEAFHFKDPTKCVDVATIGSGVDIILDDPETFIYIPDNRHFLRKVAYSWLH